MISEPVDSFSFRISIRLAASLAQWMPRVVAFYNITGTPSKAALSPPM
jgi:hypothetical protein